MTETTQNYGFKKPEQDAFYNVDDFNYNADVMDKELKRIDDKTSNITVGDIKFSDGKTVEEKFTEVDNNISAKETPQASQEKANKALDAAKSYTDEVANGLGDKISILNGSGEIKEKANKIDLDEHKSNTSNPHRVNKSQVGLGYVENYGIATKAEAELGISNEKYMTPLRVKEAISKSGIVSSIFSGALSAPTVSERRNLRIPLGKIPTEFIKIFGVGSGGLSKSIGHGYIDIKTGKVFMREVYPNNSGYDWYTNKIDTVINDTSEKHMEMRMLDSHWGTYKPRLDRISLEGNELILRYYWADSNYNNSVKIDSILLEVL